LPYGADYVAAILKYEYLDGFVILQFVGIADEAQG